ncbi:MAG: ABC transporter permease [Roseivirga sp.]
MLKSFILVSLRNLVKYKVSSIISSASLALGILFAFVIFKFTAFERSFDKAVPDFQEKVRLNFMIKNGGNTTVHANTAPYPFTDLFAAQSAEVESYARFYDAGEGILAFEDQVSIKTEGITFADESLLDFFGVEIIQGGDIDDFDTRSVVVSEALASRMFGEQPAVGKTVTYLGVYDFVIKGVFKDLPENSSVDFQLVGAMDFIQTLRPAYYQEGKNWGGYSFHTFYKLAAGTDHSYLADKFRDIYYQRFEIDAEKLAGEVFDFELIALEDIHLNSGVALEETASGGESKIRMLEYLAFVILAIAWINFINLQATKAPQRMKEIGVRKVFGAGGKNLYAMFCLEFVLLNLMSLAVAIGLLSVLNPYLEGLTTVNLATGIFPWSAHHWLPIFLLTGIVVSSVYPAIVTVRNGVSLKSTYADSRGSWFKKGLVTVQFAVSLFMIAYTLTVYLQVDYMTNQDPGFDTAKVLMINGPVTQMETNRQNAEFVKQQALNFTGVELATWGGASPGVNQGWQGNIREMDSPDALYQTAYFSNITNHYFEVFDIEVLAGRIPLLNTPHNEPRLVVNERALKGWGWNSPEEAIGKRIGYGSGSTVVAVVENFNSLGFQSEIDPRVFIVDHLYKAQTANDFFLLRIDPRQTEEIVGALQDAYISAFPGNPFQYSFLDEEFDKLYAAEIAYNKVFSIFSALAIALACVGMLGLVRFSAINRRREIGIRKVLGSGELRIVRLFLKEYLWLVAMAFIIATPVSYYLIDIWLATFAYHIQLSLDLFLMPLLTLLILTIITVGSISYRASLANPVNILKEL